MTNIFDTKIIRTSTSSPSEEGIILPVLPPEASDLFELEIYVQFMRQLRLLQGGRRAVHVLAAIEVAAEVLDLSYGFTARILADLGLRAPRHALPEEYLDLVERSMLRRGAVHGGPCASTVEMARHWGEEGEDLAGCAVGGSFSEGLRPSSEVGAPTPI